MNCLTEIRETAYKELEKIANSHALNAQSLDNAMKLTAVVKNVDKIEMYESGCYDTGSSRGGDWYAMGQYNGGYSGGTARNEMNRVYGGYNNGDYRMMNKNNYSGYSGGNMKAEIASRLEEIMQTSSDAHERENIRKALEMLR